MNKPGKTMPAVLVVDDDPVCRLFCAQALAAGYHIFAASDGSSAIRIALRERPRLILTDMHLPDMTGAEAMAGLLKLWPEAKTDCRFIGLSGDDSSSARSAMLAAGFSLILPKPFEIETLLACVRKVESQLLKASAAQVQRYRPATAFAAPVPQPVSAIQLQTIFRAELHQQLYELDRMITSLDWKRATEILHRLCGAAALAGYSTFARRGRLLLQQLHQAHDNPSLAGTYLDFLGEAADLPGDQSLGTSPGLRPGE